MKNQYGKDPLYDNYDVEQSSSDYQQQGFQNYSQQHFQSPQNTNFPIITPSGEYTSLQSSLVLRFFKENGLIFCVFIAGEVFGHFLDFCFLNHIHQFYQQLLHW